MRTSTLYFNKGTLFGQSSEFTLEKFFGPAVIYVIHIELISLCVLCDGLCMSAQVYVCACVVANTQTHTTQKHIHAHTCNAHTCMQAYASTCMCAHTHTHACMHTNTHTFNTHTHTHTHTQPHTHTQAWTCVHTQTH